MFKTLFPERDGDPRDDRTGWERPHDVAACPCGRAVVVRGLCAYCLHESHQRELMADREDFAESYARDAAAEVHE